MKKYKAIICDIDGTLIPNKEDGMPSKKVIDAVKRASQKIHFGVATARPYFLIKHLVKNLNLSGPSIIHGGAQIINLTSGKVLKEQKIAAEDILKVFAITQKMNLVLKIDEETESIEMPKIWHPHDIFGAYISALTLKRAKSLEKKLSNIPTISVHLVPSWHKGKITVDISHASVGKQYAILEIAQILGITTDEIIAVGDGYNDFPLLMACGLKVAMGNAVQELKDIADYIAPSVEEDGIVDVIEKFIL
jgi:Cof subfamily protein (haloacid dehalogenase superfamily)